MVIGNNEGKVEEHKIEELSYWSKRSIYNYISQDLSETLRDSKHITT